MYIIIACSKNIFIKNLNVVSYCYINYYTGKCSKVSLKAFTLNNQWSFGVDPKYPLVDLTNIYTHTISKIFYFLCFYIKHHCIGQKVIDGHKLN